MINLHTYALLILLKGVKHNIRWGVKLIYYSLKKRGSQERALSSTLQIDPVRSPILPLIFSKIFKRKRLRLMPFLIVRMILKLLTGLTSR